MGWVCPLCFVVFVVLLICSLIFGSGHDNSRGTRPDVEKCPRCGFELNPCEAPTFCYGNCGSCQARIEHDSRCRPGY